MAIFFLIVLGAAFLFSALTSIIFWYEVLNLPPGQFCPDDHGGRRKLALTGLASSFGSQLIVYVTYVFGLMRGLSMPAPYGSKAKPPVLFVHGLYHNPSAWIFFRWWLGRRGFEQLHSFRYSSFGPDFETIAALLAARIREVSAEHGGAKVVLIGHSLGGLLIRVVMGDPGTAGLVAAVATLGAPFGFSKLAVLAPGKLGAWLSPQSPLRGRLPAFPDPGATPWLCLASPVDNMVLPPSALVPDCPGPRFALTRPVCHIGMLFHKPTCDLVGEFLDQALAAKPEGAK